MRRTHRSRAEHFPARPATHAPEAPAVRSTRAGGPSQDTALYNCYCGFVFEAAVSTSVGCPHCGGTQAW
jgi:hypothetical protein